MSASSSRHLTGAVRRLSLAALPAAILLAGCGSSGSTTATSQTTATQSGPAIVAAGGKKASAGGGTGSGTAATAHAHGAPAGSSTSSGAAHTPAATTTATTKASTPASIHRAAPPAGERLLRSFAGSDNTRLGTVVVSSAEELVWQAGRPPIQIFAANGFILVNSQASNGSIHLSRGTYRGVRVATHGSWTVELRARA